MENLEPFQLWLLMAAVAYIAFMIGRASGRSGNDGLSPEERRFRAQQEAESAFSSLELSKQEEVDRLLNDGKVIAAVRVVREAAGIGLKDAKAAVDWRRRMIKG